VRVDCRVGSYWRNWHACRTFKCRCKYYTYSQAGAFHPKRWCKLLEVVCQVIPAWGFPIAWESRFVEYRSKNRIPALRFRVTQTDAPSPGSLSVRVNCSKNSCPLREFRCSVPQSTSKILYFSVKRSVHLRSLPVCSVRSTSPEENPFHAVE